MTEKVLVTGGSGFIGSYLVKKLVSLGYQVTVLDNNSRGSATRLSTVHDQIVFIEGDIRDPAVVDKACRGIDTVYHLAYINGTKNFYKVPGLILDIAMRGMINILDACKSHKIQSLFIASSSEVYQRASQIPTSEDVSLSIPDIQNPRYTYGGGKIAMELLAVHYATEFIDRVIIFRPHNVYGPDMGTDHVVPEFIERALSIKPDQSSSYDFPILGDGTQTRSFIYIDDFIDALTLIGEVAAKSGIYHIGTQDEITIMELANEIASLCNINIRVVPSAPPLGETDRRCPNISKLSALGFEPNFSLSEGLLNTLKWHQSKLA